MVNLTRDDVQLFATSVLLSNMSLLCLAHGNINITTVSALNVQLVFLCKGSKVHNRGRVYSHKVKARMEKKNSPFFVN